MPVVISCRPIYRQVASQSSQVNQVNVRREEETHVLGDGGGTVKTQQQGSLELRLGTLDFGNGGTYRHSGPFFEGKVGKVVNIHGATRKKKSQHGQQENEKKQTDFSETR